MTEAYNNEPAAGKGNPVIITADSTVDLPAELIERYDVRVIPLTIILGEETFPDSCDYTPFVMYERYHKDGMLPKTAAPGVQAFEDFFKDLTGQGYDVVHFDISSELSNSYNAARMAAEEIPGVYVIDSCMLSSGIGLLAIEAAEYRDRGMDAAAIAGHIEH